MPQTAECGTGLDEVLGAAKSCTKLCSNLPYLVQSMIFSAADKLHWDMYNRVHQI